ncbi:MAG TPA: hypothetical protein VMR29_06890 [Candidatus Binatia bacterium]|nr:hypothetical protein [Candidatus Binatia bacterium]
MKAGIKITIAAITLLPLLAACSHTETVRRTTSTTTTLSAPEPPPIVEKRTTITETPD